MSQEGGRAMQALPSGDGFTNYALLELDEAGQFVRRDSGTGRRGSAVGVAELPDYLSEAIRLPAGVTDVFVWVHGWRTDLEGARRGARRLFHGIAELARTHAGRYPQLGRFVPGFLAVHWPSMSGPTLGAYKRIRDRAKAMTEEGAAEFFLASLLGYLDQELGGSGGSGPLGEGEVGVLQAARGFYVHCVGHSFGGRFLTAAVRAAAEPRSPKTLSLMRGLAAAERRRLSATESVARPFAFTVDSMLVFQMAAGEGTFQEALKGLMERAPLRGPVVLTHSKHDTANCVWHPAAEWLEKGIGCQGVKEPKSYLHRIKLLGTHENYAHGDFAPKRIVNVNANEAYRQGGIAEGSHSDFWYEESVHLLLSLVQAMR